MRRPSHRAFPGPAASGPGKLGGLLPPCCPASARLSVTSQRAPLPTTLLAPFTFLWFPFLQGTYHSGAECSLVMDMLVVCLPGGVSTPAGQGCVRLARACAPSSHKSTWAVSLDEHISNAHMHVCCVPIHMLHGHKKALSGLQDPIESPKRKHSNHVIPQQRR